MKKIKVLTVIGTRPEIIRLSSVIKKMEVSNVIDHKLVHTGQNYDYELNEIFFKDFGLKRPDYFLNAATESASETIGNIFIEINKVFDKEKPDAVLILGDTNSCLSAVVAKKKKIPVFHMEAGNRCFDQRVPEEINRKIVDHISDINLTYSDIAREYLLKEGFPADQIIKTGSPMYEVLEKHKEKIKASNILNELSLIESEYFVVSLHREENVNNKKNLDQIVEALNSIAVIYDKPVVVSLHPRTKSMINDYNLEKNLKLIKPLGFSDYIKLQTSSKMVLSDSGTISEESSILKFKALNIREAHERPEAMEEASVMMVGVSKERILQGVEFLAEQSMEKSKIVNDYNVDNVSEKVVKIIISYIDYVNTKIWKKKLYDK